VADVLEVQDLLSNHQLCKRLTEAFDLKEPAQVIARITVRS
jgi:hypothetical protein